MSLQDAFNQASIDVKQLSEDPGNLAKLRLYALFKQATEGNVSAPQPGFTDFVGRAKWDAWKALDNMPSDTAMQQYIDLVESLK